MRQKSTSGYVFTLGGGATTWRSVKQTIIARSTMKYEFVALGKADSEAKWLKKILNKLLKPTPIKALLLLIANSYS